MKKLLVINAGSSSMKYRVYGRESLDVLADGLAERIFLDGRISIEAGDRKETNDVALASHIDAVKQMVKLLQQYGVIDSLDEIVGIGHRVVQGGEDFTESSLLGNKEIEIIDGHSKLAPLHNPGEIAVIKAFQELVPRAKNVAVFDTSFHQSMPSEVFMYGVPRAWYTKHGVRKYGMHGTSHKYITLQVEKILGKQKVNIISAHLGNGASLAAIKDSKSFNTSMGLTPLAGIIMGTRSGDIDPAIIEYMTKETGQSVSEITNILNGQSGVKGLSGISNDFRDITTAAQEGNKDAIETLNIYAKRVADVIAQYQNDLENKVDALVFTAGVGENAAHVREMIMNKVFTLDTKLDSEVNKERVIGGHLEISKPGSKTKVFVIRTDEEQMIVNDLIEKAGL